MERSSYSLNRVRGNFLRAAKYLAVYSLAYIPAYFATVAIFEGSPAKPVYGVISGFWSAAYFGQLFDLADYRAIPYFWVLTSGLYVVWQLYYAHDGLSDYALSDPLAWELCLLGGLSLSIPLIFNASAVNLVRYIRRKRGLKEKPANLPEQPMI